MIVWMFLFCADLPGGETRCEQVTVKSEAVCMAMKAAHRDGVCTPVKLWSANA